MTSDELKVSRGSYMKFTPQRKAQVARYAIECGNKEQFKDTVRNLVLRSKRVYG
jgi:hypothetical protein